ncbi:MAG: acetylornithine carbamoyltransferase [Cyclobacteriaceae bacterium]|jgi:N-succinyl-L-ornithine transcarbamylase|nr:acetylornithine carbamoyltransferase [Flammeovirgaceae bacterium]
MKKFTSVHDTPDIHALIERAIHYKAKPLGDRQLGQGKRMGLLFMNPSMRTRLSTQVAAQNLGLEAVVFNTTQEGWAMEFADGAVMNGTTVEHVKDAAPVLGQYVDLLGVRTFPGLKDRTEDYSEFILNQFIRYSGVPIVSLESATLHPLQSLADLVTITELRQKKKPKVVLTWAPHIKPLPHCVANSFAQWINAWGEAELVITHPGGYELDQQFTQNASIQNEQLVALQDADFVYVKNWSSYHRYGEMPPVEGNWMLTREKLRTAPEAKVMHCLPVRRNVELSDDVLDSPHSIVTRQAGNRVWAAQAVLAEIMKTNF